MTLAPIALALGSGMLATINPCAFIMLPSLASFYLGADHEGYEARSMAARFRDGAMFGLATTAGFVAVFGVLGLVISLGAGGIAQFLPWGTVVIGAGLIVLGLWLFAGRHVFVRLPTWEAPLRSRSVPAMALYGVAYAVASLGCTLPVFLVVVGTSLVASPVRLLLFLAYGLGMGIVLTATALSTVLFQGALTGYLRALVPYVKQIGALLLIAAGVYMVYTELPVLAHQGALAPAGGPRLAQQWGASAGASLMWPDARSADSQRRSGLTYPAASGLSREDCWTSGSPAASTGSSSRIGNLEES